MCYKTSENIRESWCYMRKSPECLITHLFSLVYGLLPEILKSTAVARHMPQYHIDYAKFLMVISLFKGFNFPFLPFPLFSFPSIFLSSSFFLSSFFLFPSPSYFPFSSYSLFSFFSYSFFLFPLPLPSPTPSPFPFPFLFSFQPFQGSRSWHSFSGQPVPGPHLPLSKECHCLPWNRLIIRRKL